MLSLAYDDDGTTFGPVWTHRGWIGLRQMGHTVRCEYGDPKTVRRGQAELLNPPDLPAERVRKKGRSQMLS